MFFLIGTDIIDLFAKKKACLKYLYSCKNFIPNQKIEIINRFANIILNKNDKI